MTTRTQRPTTRVAAALLALVLVAAACGDDGDDADTRAPGDDSASDSSASDDSVSGDSVSGDGDSTVDPSGSAGSGGATVTIGGEQFDFEQELVCIALGGAVSGTFTNDEGVEVTIDVPPEDWESDTRSDWDPPSLTLRDERDEMDWKIYESGGDVESIHPEAAGAAITNFSVDGSHATGSGMTIDRYGITQANVEGVEPPSLVPVTFGFECS